MCLAQLIKQKFPYPAPTIRRQGWRALSRMLLFSRPFARWLIYRNSCTKLFIGGLSYDTNEPVLKEAFKSHGEILEAKVICHHVTGKSKGYGFVQFSCENAASAALREMDGQLLDGRNIRIQYAHKV